MEMEQMESGELEQSEEADDSAPQSEGSYAACTYERSLTQVVFTGSGQSRYGSVDCGSTKRVYGGACALGNESNGVILKDTYPARSATSTDGTSKPTGANDGAAPSSGSSDGRYWGCRAESTGSGTDHADITAFAFCCG